PFRDWTSRGCRVRKSTPARHDGCPARTTAVIFRPSLAASSISRCHGTEKAAATMSYREQNREAGNRLADRNSRFARVATDEECRHPLETLDSRGWLPASVAGLDVLCLASGGGWQSILYAVAGARVTVVDLSPSMLRLDEREAARRGLTVR